MKPICPKCGSICSQAEYHLSAPDYYAVCLECDEDFYKIEIKEWEKDENMKYYLDDKQVTAKEFYDVLDNKDVGWEEGILPTGEHYFMIHTEEICR